MELDGEKIFGAVMTIWVTILSYFMRKIDGKVDKDALKELNETLKDDREDANASRGLMHEKIDDLVSAVHSTALTVARLEVRNGDIDRIENEVVGLRQRHNELADRFRRSSE